MNMYLSSDMTTWNLIKLANVKEIICGNGKYLALLANSIIYSSTDGVNFTNNNSNLSTIISNSSYGTNFCFVNSRFFTCGYKVTSCNAYSSVFWQLTLINV